MDEWHRTNEEMFIALRAGWHTYARQLHARLCALDAAARAERVAREWAGRTRWA